MLGGQRRRRQNERIAEDSVKRPSPTYFTPATSPFASPCGEANLRKRNGMRGKLQPQKTRPKPRTRRERPRPVTHGASLDLAGSLPPRGAQVARQWFGPRREIRVRKSAERGGKHGHHQETTGKCQPLAAYRTTRERSARRLLTVCGLHPGLRHEFRAAKDASTRPRL